MSASLDQIEKQFASDVSKGTGIDPRVIYSWEQVEGAYAPGGTGGLNFLNLRPYKGDPYSAVSPGGFEQFSSLPNAEAATIRRIRQPFLWSYLQAAPHTPAGEIGAISASGWDAGHYQEGGYNSLDRRFQQDWGTGTPYSGPKPNSVPLLNPDGTVNATGTGSAQDISAQNISFLGSIFGAISGPFKAFYDFFKGIWDFFTSEKTWIRIGLFVLGLALLVIGLRIALSGVGAA